ncbi:hypothetical protein Tco_0231272 [Tanacetum coccineum]
MAFSDSEVHNDKPCTKSCLKNYETLKKQYDDLLAKLHQTEFKASTYKRGLDTVEAQLVTYRKNEVLFSEEVAVLKREVGCKTYEFNMLKTEFEKVKQEKEGIDFKIEKFENASKDLDKLLGSQITDNSKKGLGYHAVPPPHPLIYNAPTKLDLSYSGLEEFKQPEFEGYGVKVDKSVCEKSSKEIKKTPGAPIIEDWVSDDEEQDEPKSKVEAWAKHYSAAKIHLQNPENHEKPVKKQVSTKDANTNLFIEYCAASPIGLILVSLQVCTASNGSEVAALSAKCESKEVLSEDRQEDFPLRSVQKSRQTTGSQGNNEDLSKACRAIDGCRFLIGVDMARKTKFEKVKQEKDGIDFKIEKFEKASKDLDQLLGSQITDKSKKGLGYSAVPSTHPLIYNRPNKLDLSYSGLDEFKEPEFKEQVSQDKSSFVDGYGPNTSKSVSEVEPKKVRKNDCPNY